MKKLLIFTDTYNEQLNGVTRCIDNLCANLPRNIQVTIVSSDEFVSIPFLGYKEIRLSFAFPRRIQKRIREIQPDYIHIMTEWPIGLTAAYVCKRKKIPYTTTFHTKFPEYLHMRNRLVKEEYVHQYLHYIHDGAEQIFISNDGLHQYLEENGYERRIVVPFGIDHSVFFPWEKTLFRDIPTPILLFVGRIAVEKNIGDFLDMNAKYQKVVVGDGPLYQKYKEEYPDVLFLGKKSPKELGEIYRSVDAFVFPSKTDTLGLVNLEAMASGLPIIAYDIENTRGVIEDGKTGILVPEWQKLESAIPKIPNIHPQDSIDFVKDFTWENYAQKFISHQFPISKNLWI